MTCGGNDTASGDAVRAAGIELGGTKTVVAVTNRDGAVLGSESFATTEPEITLAQAVESIESIADGEPTHLGIAAFGPVRVDPDHPEYGRVLKTPKPEWSGHDILGTLRKSWRNAPMVLDTDVNGAALAEGRFGAARGCTHWAYITIGTGIGAGFVSDGRLVHGTLHPEFGHGKPPRHPRDSFPGHCPFHGDCLEGMASGPAIEARWKCSAKNLPPDHEAWEFEAWYLSHACLNIISILSTERILFGGGVSQAPGLLERISRQLAELAGGYFEAIGEGQGDVVRAAELGQSAGLAGSVLLGYPELPSWRESSKPE